MSKGGRSVPNDRRTDPSETSLADIYRSPRDQPLAALMATLILVAFAYQAYITVQQSAWWAGILVLVAAYLAYRIARVGWRLENSYIEATLAADRLDPTGDREQSDEPPSPSD